MSKVQKRPDERPAEWMYAARIGLYFGFDPDNRVANAMEGPWREPTLEENRLIEEYFDDLDKEQSDG